MQKLHLYNITLFVYDSYWKAEEFFFESYWVPVLLVKQFCEIHFLIFM